MPDTGERREITRRVNAKEAETVQESKKLASRTRQLSARTEAKNRARVAPTKERSGTRSSDTK
jgi:hypothetical protein